MKLIIDARALKMYPVGGEGFTGGTENMVRELARGLADKGHTVHVVTPDLESEDQRGAAEWWWGPRGHPTQGDAVVMVHSLEFVGDYSADHLILATNGVDPDLGPEHAYASGVDAFPVFSKKHAELMRQFRPTIPEEKCFVTGLGVNTWDYMRQITDWGAKGYFHGDPTGKVPGRLLYANDPARGLWHVLDIFDHLKKQVPHASLRVAYDFDRQFEPHRWVANSLAQVLWECKQRLATTEGVTSLGALSRQELVREQLECHVHAMPSDPPNVGSQIHGLAQMECAAAGAALVLSTTEAFPEVFGAAATLLPLPGTFLPDAGRRYDAQDWADVISELMQDAMKWEEASRKARALAEQHTWEKVIDRWHAMLLTLSAKVAVPV